MKNRLVSMVEDPVFTPQLGERVLGWKLLLHDKVGRGLCIFIFHKLGGV